MVFSVNNGDRLYHTDINVISVVQKFSVKSGCEVTPAGGMDVNVSEGIVLFNGEVRSISSTTVSICLLYTSPSPRDLSTSRMPSSA